MSNIDRWIKFFEHINDINRVILHIPLIPYYITYLACIEISSWWEGKKRQRWEEQDPWHQIARKLKTGELRFCDVPHQHKESSNTFSFYLNEDKEFQAYQFFYVAPLPDERISRFLQEEKEAIAHWSEWYGFEITVVENTDEFLSEMCFPQDKVFLKHGLMRSHCICTSQETYGQFTRPFNYYELDADSPTPLLEQLYIIVQNVLREP